jgi:hypothetical protein
MGPHDFRIEWSVHFVNIANHSRNVFGDSNRSVVDIPRKQSTCFFLFISFYRSVFIFRGLVCVFRVVSTDDIQRFFSLSPFHLKTGSELIQLFR